MPALVTPFDQEGEILGDAHRHNLGFLRERGIRGFLIGGSTGEGPYLEPGERRTLVSLARETIEDAFLLCGIAAESERQATAQIAEADEGGADAVLIITPTTLARDRDSLVEGYYASVADRSPLPVFLYTVPRVTAYNLPVDTIVNLETNSNIVGIKDSSSDPLRISQTAGAASDDFAIFAGASAALALSIVAGAYGAITASTNYAPSLVADVVNGAKRSLKKARDAQETLTGLSRLVESRGIPGVKAAAAEAGLQPGYPRAPLPGFTGAETDAMRRSLAALRHQLLG